jgi:hypothetical protein
MEQATAMLDSAKTARLHAYVVVSLLTGIRTGEARALQWSHVVASVQDDAEWRPVTEAGFDHQRFAIYVWRSVRANGDTKTEKSRRTLELPGQAADALREHRARQPKERLAAGPLWHGDHQGRRNHERHLQPAQPGEVRLMQWLPVWLPQTPARSKRDHGVISEVPSDLEKLWVGVTGFEPAASSSRTKRATKLRHTPQTAREV